MNDWLAILALSIAIALPAYFLTPHSPGLHPVDLEVTAYCPKDGAPWDDGLTALLWPAERGAIAADWRIFPPGTILYVPGYGYGVVLDRGSAIKGRRLDLLFEDCREAMKWGRRRLRVWVLGRITLKKGGLR